MGNEAGKGKYAKMDKAEVPNSSSKEDAYCDESSRYVMQTKESKNSSISVLASLKQGINSGYHSIVLNPNAEATERTGRNVNNENIK